MDAADWRAQLQPDFRQRQVNEIKSALKMQCPFGDEDKLVEIEKVSQSFEHKAFAGSTSQGVYLQRISLMILSILGPNHWRAQLQPDSRQRIVNKIMECFQRRLPLSGPDGLDECRTIAERFEDRIYNVATSQSDYLRKISLKMLCLETRGQNNMVNPMPCNPGPNHWRAQLQPDSRQRIVNKIMETFQRHLPLSGPDGLDEYRTIAERFEDRIYNIATSQSDYLRKISLKMLTLETQGQNNMVNPMPYNPGGTSNGTSANGIK